MQHRQLERVARVLPPLIRALPCGSWRREGAIAPSRRSRCADAKPNYMHRGRFGHRAGGLREDSRNGDETLAPDSDLVPGPDGLRCKGAPRFDCSQRRCGRSAPGLQGAHGRSGRKARTCHLRIRQSSHRCDCEVWCGRASLGPRIAKRLSAERRPCCGRLAKARESATGRVSAMSTSCPHELSRPRRDAS